MQNLTQNEKILVGALKDCLTQMDSSPMPNPETNSDWFEAIKNGTNVVNQLTLKD